jgi:DNA-binding NarL/FixJ family response regulator
MTIRIFVLDDHELVRTGLQTLLECEEDMEVVGQAATAQLGLEQIAALQPDVAILDVRLPDGSGIEVCREIRSTYPQIACLMLTSYADDEALFSASWREQPATSSRRSAAATSSATSAG